MKKPGKILIGTSGWVYKAWHKKFYPPKEKNFLKYYSEHFLTVEINNSFYKIPTKEVFKKWHEESSDSFTFSVKLNRYITHIARFEETYDTTEKFLKNCSELKEKLGPILVQLPPFFPFKPERLESFFKDTKEILGEMGIKVRFALEPRHWSWFKKENIAKTLKILKKYNATPVYAHSDKFLDYEPDIVLPLKFVYIRLHGPKKFTASQYRAELLKPWAEKIKKWSEEGKDVYLYFNNDIHGYAIDDSKILKDLL